MVDVRSGRAGALSLLVLCLGTWSSLARAQDASPEGASPAGASPEGASRDGAGESASPSDGLPPGEPVRPQARYPAPATPFDDPPRVLAHLAESGERVPLYLVFEEMIEELISELQDAPRDRVSPLAIRSVRGGRPLSADYLDQVEAKVIQAIHEHTSHTVRRCLTCGSIRSRVEDDAWIVSLGIADHEQLVREAERLGVVAFMDLRISYLPEQNVAMLMAEIFRAEDGTVVWSRSYRSDATTAAILRTGERIESRAERVEELERRLDQRPLLEHQPSIGGGFIQISGPEGIVFGAMVGYRLEERFGEDRRWLFSLGGEGFFNFSSQPLIGAFVNVMLQYDVIPPNLNDFVLRTGPALGAFIAGQEGNSFVAEWTADGIFQFLLGVGISVFYFVPTDFGGQDLGGIGAKVRFTVNFR